MFAEYLKTKFGIGEPIYVEDIAFEGRSRSWVRGELKKLVDRGELRRFCRGVYYFPDYLPWGAEVSLGGYKIIERRYITDGAEVYGYSAGLVLLNSMGLIDQVPVCGEIVSNRESSRGRWVHLAKGGAQGGKRKSGGTYVKKSRAIITKDNVKTLQFLELMTIISQGKYIGKNEINAEQIKKIAGACGVTKSGLARYAGAFPPKALKIMEESGIYDELA